MHRRHASRRRCPLTGFPDAWLYHNMKSLRSFSYVWTRMHAIDSCMDMDNLPAASGIVVYPHNVISASG
ncbi:hypothetical protein CBM2592_B180075 [Cupriavidus taiwanensis]|nr:hypothetical protein CBM2592_B180075 [Cupriavidus taiwanensis]SOY69892.1 hypothetical protein CBM2588_B200075 [Cupriavidus taiwanensis]SOZ28389.1 hypothetical protein CBM2608_B140289 [Cupriavidus taiwanensis]SOZ71948.1 hypothetical protein CBM2617_B180285 [Cupriavidus taiwanensis]SOZ87249.1 hypothetical protein CBM2618_B200281 [Cupriavidus taiwanensis]